MSVAGDYPPLEAYGWIADGVTSALVSTAGSIDWCCLPRLDSASTFGRLLDWQRGGYCQIVPTGEHSVRREYGDRSLVLETRFSSEAGDAVLYDCLVGEGLGFGYPAVLRIVEGTAGAMSLAVHVEPRFDYGEVRPWMRHDGPGIFTAIGGDDALVVSMDDELELHDGPVLRGRSEVRAGERRRLLLRFARPETVDPGPCAAPLAAELDEVLATARLRVSRETDQARGAARDDAAVMRSAIVLKGLVHPATGAMAAAATTSLPEVVGGKRNWDYRYSWIRDSTFAARSLAEVGFAAEANALRGFVARSSAGRGEELQIAYGLGGERRLGEQTLGDLEGYRGSQPVRIGNAAAGQLQLDVLGEVLNLNWHWHRRGHAPDEDHWGFLVSLIELAAAKWDQPDAGMWEWRDDPQHFVHSKALCWSALDRGIALARECGRVAPLDRWARSRDEIREAIDSRGYDDTRETFVQAFDGEDLDAALLLLPAVGYLAWDDERMIGTADAISSELDAGAGLLFRYRNGNFDSQEGAFLACSFWLAECFARQGRHERARETFEATTATANDLGLFSEEYDTDRGQMLGNLPQALTHLSHIGAAVALREAEGANGRRSNQTAIPDRRDS